MGFLSDGQIRRKDNGIDDRFQLERIDDTTLGAWLFSTSNAIWSEHGINDPLCQNWEHWAVLCWQILVGMNHCHLWKTACWCRFAQQRNLFLPTPSLTAFAQISRGPLFVQISGKYLEGLSSPKYLANISRAFVFGFQRLHRLLHLVKFDARTMLSNCALCCNPEGQSGLQQYPEKKTTLLCSCAEPFSLIFLNTETYIYISRNIRFPSNLK